MANKAKVITLAASMERATIRVERDGKTPTTITLQSMKSVGHTLTQFKDGGAELDERAKELLDIAGAR